MTFADAADAWLTHGTLKRNLKRSTIKDYRQVLDTYLLPADDEAALTPYGRAAFATKPLRDLRAADVKRWHDGLPYGRTTEKLLMVVRAVCAHARARGWLDDDPTSTVERQPVRYSGDYDYFSREEIAALVPAAASEQSERSSWPRR